MRKSYIILLLICISQTIFGQEIGRKILRGRIVADSIEVENLTVYNISSNIGAITDLDGKFSINARATDTLYIQGLSYDSKKYVLTDKDFWLPVLEIKLKVRITELNEVIITPYTLTGILEVDTKRIQVYGDGFSKIDAKVVKNYEDDVRTKAPLNIALSNNLAQTGVNFMLIGKGIANLLGIKGNSKANSERVFEQRRIRYIQSKSFSEHMHERFSNNFFTETLKIKNESIPMFMSFAELNVYELSPLLKSENELKLIEYLVIKAKEFKLQ
ncbi:hypothetical protein ACFSX9_14525 [Flavobacterium ardleyense]|uniref:CarboxypepD_reg-like domain-containing protein n=1 Tax=Flavobacterium ardleyense TaxID=2038737 RepID=A0ABW5ZEQ8_9FLAO